MLKIADLTRLEVHGPEKEIEKLRSPLAELQPQFFTPQYGFRRKLARRSRRDLKSPEAGG